MTPALASRIAASAWLAWLAYWLLAASNAKLTRQRDSLSAILSHRLVLWIGAAVFLWPPARLGPLGRQLFLPTPSVLWLGLAFTFAGLAFSVWARTVLGSNWSAEIVLKSGHELIRTGPYARIRHPIYSGLLVAMVGAVLLRGRANALLALVLFTLSFWIKARREEALLAREFGAAFELHRKQTGMFLPRIRSV